ncbi:alpha/beta hydrolase [Sandaracinus amylolyticus]|nr:alpha/beta hydrolase [Sandaracinus amylolyticus]
MIERVVLESEGCKLVGRLHLPQGASATSPLPAVVIGGSWLTVKEQMAARYAERLASDGIAALTFDFRGFGESEGAPRQHESPAKKAADFVAAARFLAARPEVSRVGALGVCASAGYLVKAIAEHALPVASLVTVAAWLHDASIVRAFYGGEDGVAGRLAAAARASADETIPAASATDPRAAMFGPFDYYLSPSRAAIPAWRNEMTTRSWHDWLSFDPIALGARVHVPSLHVHSRAAATPMGLERMLATMREPTPRVIWRDGDQFAFYDDEPTVRAAASDAAAFFRETLVEGGAR